MTCKQTKTEAERQSHAEWLALHTRALAEHAAELKEALEREATRQTPALPVPR
jgi:hypothetical protein